MNAVFDELLSFFLDTNIMMQFWPLHHVCLLIYPGLCERKYLNVRLNIKQPRGPFHDHTSCMSLVRMVSLCMLQALLKRSPLPIAILLLAIYFKT